MTSRPIVPTSLSAPLVPLIVQEGPSAAAAGSWVGTRLTKRAKHPATAHAKTYLPQLTSACINQGYGAAQYPILVSVGLALEVADLVFGRQAPGHGVRAAEVAAHRKDP